MPTNRRFPPQWSIEDIGAAQVLASMEGPTRLERIKQRGAAVLKLLLLLTGVVLLTADYAFAQGSPDPTPMECRLIKLAVAQYGFAAARRHALETYGPEAVKTGDKCFTNVGLRLRATTKNGH